MSVFSQISNWAELRHLPNHVLSVLQECIMSGLLSVLGWKVLHIDRNNYYGGDCASLNLTNLYAKVRLMLTKPRHVCRHL
jgi:RAB protein geranylgeranyltransferase component A